MRLMILWLAVALSWTTHAQQVVATQGGSYKNSKVSVDWTVGELVISTYKGASNKLTQGFYQPGTEARITGVSNSDEGIAIDVFPNPVIDILRIKATVREYGSHLQLIDGSGSKLMSGSIKSDETIINFSGYPTGMYALLISGRKNQPVKIVKVIKK